MLEAIRPEMDRFILELISVTTFGKRSFFETQRGVLRVSAVLARDLAERLLLWRQQAGPVAETVARLLGGEGLPTPLTQSNRSAGRDPHRKAARRARTRARVVERIVSPRCRECGEILRSPTRALCDACAFEHQVGSVQRAGRANLSKMRAQGEADPARTPEARAKLGATQAKRARERADWKRNDPGETPDPAVFRTEILPRARRNPCRTDRPGDRTLDRSVVVCPKGRPDPASPLLAGTLGARHEVRRYSVNLQSTASRSAAMSAWFARLNGLLPKKPLWAAWGEGCGDSMTVCRDV